MFARLLYHRGEDICVAKDHVTNYEYSDIVVGIQARMPNRRRSSIV